MDIRCGHCSTREAPVYHGTVDAVRRCAASRRFRAAAPATARPYSATAHPISAIPVGSRRSARYALPGDDGTVRFYRVFRPTRGRYTGMTFLEVQAGDETHPVRGVAAQLVLLRIAADPAAAAARYGAEIGQCSMCGRTLTDADSRARGIGPDCAQRVGVA